MEKLLDELFRKSLDLSLTEMGRKTALSDWYVIRHFKYALDKSRK